MPRTTIWTILTWLALIFLIIWPAIADAATTEPECGSDARVQSLTLGGTQTTELASAHPFDSVLLRVSDTDSALKWSLEGKSVTPKNEHEYCYIPETAGSKTIALSTTNPESTHTFVLPVVSWGNITLVQVKPHAESGGTETIVLHNANASIVTIKNWQLKNQASRTTLAINGTIPANSDIMLTSSGKLVDGGGTYNLINESGDAVDSITYPSAPAGHVFIRTGSEWRDRDATSAVSSSNSSDMGSKTVSAVNPVEDTHVTLRGTVTHPSGDTFDMTASDGQAVHVVIHASFNGTKPRLHQGDSISVSGIWKTSSNGPYLSVRAGDTVSLLKEATKSSAPSAASTSGSETASASDETLVATNTASESQATNAPDSQLAQPSSKLTTRDAVKVPTSPWLRALFIGMITAGAALATPVKMWGAVKRVL